MTEFQQEVLTIASVASGLIAYLTGFFVAVKV